MEPEEPELTPGPALLSPGDQSDELHASQHVATPQFSHVSVGSNR